MRPSIWFVCPAHGRHEMAAICLRQLRRTCDALTQEGIEATAVIVARDENLDTARDLGFGTVERDNEFLSRRYNDGFQLALDERFNPRPASHVVPVGSDDFVDHRIFLDLPPSDTVLGFQHVSFVREDGREMVSRFLDYPGGCGVRVYPRQVVQRLGYRPADEDRKRGCDTSILVNLSDHLGDELRIVHRPTDPRSIVDFKSAGEQVTTYENLMRHQKTGVGDPFVDLEGWYPQEALDDMAALYSGRLVAA